MRFKQIPIEEGLIKLPQKLVAAVNRHAVEQYLSYLSYLLIKDRDDGVTWGKTEDERKANHHEWHEALYKTIDKFAERNGLKLSPTKNFNYPASFSQSENDLPPSYGDNKHDFQLRVQIDFTGSKFAGGLANASGAYYDPDENIIMVNGRKLLGKSPLSKDPEDVAKDIRLLQSHLRHELTHYIQFGFLQHNHPEQVADNDYGNKTGDTFNDMKRYFTSQVEFDPQVKSTIDSILNAIPVAIWRKMDVETMNAVLNRFVGGDLGKTVNRIEVPIAGTVMYNVSQKIPAVPNFLRFLKNDDMKRWRKAAKLVVTGALQELESRFDIITKTDGARSSHTDLT
jgi:hypothetical protein